MKNTDDVALSESVSSLFASEFRLQSARDNLLCPRHADLEDWATNPIVHNGADAQAMAQEFRDTRLPQDRCGTEEYLGSLFSKVIAGATNVYSPRCLGHMTGNPPSFFQELAHQIVALNQNLVKSDASRTLTLLERQILAMMHRVAFSNDDEFYDTHAHRARSTLGLITSGGTLSNLTALWVARNSVLSMRGDFSGIEGDGPERALTAHGYNRAVIIGSELAHYSFKKAAGLLGLGSHAFLPVPVDSERRMDVPALEQLLDRCQKQRYSVVAIIGIAGTTDCGSIDPLLEIARVARQRGIHFHVDAAWGFPLLFSNTYSGKLAGIEQADSICIDGHKQLHLPIGNSMVLFRDPHAALVIEQSANYLLHDESGDLGRYSLEGSRPGSAIFWDAAMRIIGSAGYQTIVEENIRKAHLFAAMIRQRPEFELVMRPQTNIVLYRYLPRGLQGTAGRSRSRRDNTVINQCTENLQKAQAAAGRTYVSRTTLRDQISGDDAPLVALRAITLNPRTTDIDLEAVLEDQVNLGLSLY